MDTLTPGGVVADALDIESKIHLFPLIFPIWVRHHPAHENGGNTMKLHITRPNVVKVMF